MHLGRAINVEISKKVVSAAVESILKSPDALMWLTQLKKKDEYTSQHSINVCIFAIALARHINLPENEIQDVGLCGLMHDIGKMKIPLNVLNKPGQFESKERDIMNSHTTLGWQELTARGGMPKFVVDAVYSHHERLDGKGYPRGLVAKKIHPYTRMVSIADVYDAISSDRVYKKGKTHLETINIMTNICGGQLDYGLVVKFIECLGIYPPGNIVEMTNGEVALVTEVNQVKKLKPKVTMLLDEDKKRIKPRMVDLAKIDLDSSGHSYAIKRIIRPEQYNLDLNHLYKIGIIQSILSGD